jgi:hypothetical protein
MRQFGAMYRRAVAAAISQRQGYSTQNRSAPLHHFQSWHQMLLLSPSIRKYVSHTGTPNLRGIITSAGISPKIDDPAIADQIAKAKEKLLSVSGSITPELHQAILDDLSIGHVPPIFHAVLMQQPCVAFRGNNTTLKHLFQIEEALPGHHNIHISKAAIKNAVPFDVGPDAFDLEGSINENGSPSLSLVNVDDDVFYYDVGATDAVVHLVNQKAAMCGYGVESTSVIGLLDIEPVKRKNNPVSWNLLTHPQSRGAIAACFDTELTSLLIGSPGIGKSWSLLYALQQALLCPNAIVLLYACKGLKIYLFLRKNDKIYAWKGNQKQEIASSNLFARGDCLVLYDPREVDNKGGAKYGSGNRQLILAMSGNERHAKSDALKLNAAARCFLGPPSKNQVKVMIPHMQSAETTDAIMKRIPAVGPIARYILTEHAYLARLEQRSDAIKQIKARPTLLEDYLDSNGMKQGGKFFPETLFITIAIPDTAITGQFDVIGLKSDCQIDALDKQTNGHNMPLGGGVSTKFQPDSQYDYEGQDTNYKKLKIVPVCAKSLEELLVGCRETLLSYLGKVRPADFLKFGDILEQIAAHDLCSPFPLVMEQQRLLYKNEANLFPGT